MALVQVLAVTPMIRDMAGNMSMIPHCGLRPADVRGRGAACFRGLPPVEVEYRPGRADGRFVAGLVQAPMSVAVPGHLKPMSQGLSGIAAEGGN